MNIKAGAPRQETVTNSEQLYEALMNEGSWWFGRKRYAAIAKRISSRIKNGCVYDSWIKTIASKKDERSKIELIATYEFMKLLKSGPFDEDKILIETMCSNFGSLLRAGLSPNKQVIEEDLETVLRNIKKPTNLFKEYERLSTLRTALCLDSSAEYFSQKVRKVYDSNDLETMIKQCREWHRVWHRSIADVRDVVSMFGLTYQQIQTLIDNIVTEDIKRYSLSCLKQMTQLVDKMVELKSIPDGCPAQAYDLAKTKENIRKTVRCLHAEGKYYEIMKLINDYTQLARPINQEENDPRQRFLRVFEKDEEIITIVIDCVNEYIKQNIAVINSAPIDCLNRISNLSHSDFRPYVLCEATERGAYLVAVHPDLKAEEAPKQA